MRRMLALVLSVASVPVGVGIGLWTALLRTTFPLSSCPLVDAWPWRPSERDDPSGDTLAALI